MSGTLPPTQPLTCSRNVLETTQLGELTLANLKCPDLKKCPSLNWTLVPEAVPAWRKRPLPKGGASHTIHKKVYTELAGVGI